MAPNERSAHRQAVIRVGPDDSTLRRRLLGSRLRERRHAAGMTLAQAGKVVHRAAASVSRWESGEKIPRPPDLAYLLGTYDVPQEERDELMALADEARAPGAETVSAVVADYDWLEGRAVRIETFQDTVVPGLLQTADYARAILRAWNPSAPPERIELALQSRLARQRRLAGERPLELAAIVSESALRHAVGGPEVRRAQLHHLIDRARQSNVELRVIPFAAGEHPGFNGSFVILRFDRPGDRDLAWITTRGGSIVFEDAEPFGRAFAGIRGVALSHRKSLAMIAAMIREAT